MDASILTPTETSKKKFPLVPVLGGCFALAIVATIAFIVIGGNLTKTAIEQMDAQPSPVKSEIAANEFFTALKTDPANAYTLTATEFQAVTTSEDLVNYVEETSIFRDYTMLNFPSVSAEGEALNVLIGTIETDAEYTTLYVETTLEDDGVWRVNYFELGFQPETAPDGTAPVIGTIPE